VQKYGYLAMIVFTLIGSFWLEVFLKVGVLKQVKRMVQTIAPIAFLFIAWDKYAIAHGHWFFDRDQILGVYGPWRIPIEEYLFFIIVPIAALMTIEAVRKTKKDWHV
jgi:lycopene cyclase domain-containing protein